MTPKKKSTKRKKEKSWPGMIVNGYFLFYCLLLFFALFFFCFFFFFCFLVFCFLFFIIILEILGFSSNVIGRVEQKKIVEFLLLIESRLVFSDIKDLSHYWQLALYITKYQPDLCKPKNPFCSTLLITLQLKPIKSKNKKKKPYQSFQVNFFFLFSSLWIFFSGSSTTIRFIL